MVWRDPLQGNCAVVNNSRKHSLGKEKQHNIVSKGAPCSICRTGIGLTVRDACRKFLMGTDCYVRGTPDVPRKEQPLDLKITGRHVEVSEHEKKHLTERIERLTRHFDGVHKIEVTVGGEGADMKAEIVVHVVRGVRLAAEGIGANVNAAIDGALDRMDGQIKKLKERMKDRRS